MEDVVTRELLGGATHGSSHLLPAYDAHIVPLPQLLLSRSGVPAVVVLWCCGVVGSGVVMVLWCGGWWCYGVVVWWMVVL